MNVRYGKVETALGEAECAVTQIVHFKASVAVEWWCATNAAAEKKVSSKHSNAIFLEIDCITAALLKDILKSTLEEERIQPERLISCGCRPHRRFEYPGNLASREPRSFAQPTAERAVTTWSVASSGPLEVDLAAERAQFKARSNYHPGFE